MIDLQFHLHRPPAPASAPEPVKAPGSFTVRKMAHGEELIRNPDAERSIKAAKLVKGAKSVEEHKILTALRERPATSIGDLANRSSLNETAAMLAFMSLTSRNLAREVSNAFGTTTMVAMD